MQRACSVQPLQRGCSSAEKLQSNIHRHRLSFFFSHVDHHITLTHPGVGLCVHTCLNCTQIRYDANRQHIEEHEPIPGGYTNVDKIAMKKLNLDRHPNIRMLIVKEMQQVLQWWTRMRLKHTSTYGIRIYSRGSMLIKHVDRVDTHLASAVMQVAQDVDEDGGWPLEIDLGNKSVGQVYLQPGEIVLYVPSSRVCLSCLLACDERESGCAAIIYSAAVLGTRTAIDRFAIMCCFAFLM